jgi:hypothetical protein
MENCSKEFCWDANDTYHFVDQKNNMMLRRSLSVDPKTVECKDDAIDRTFQAYFTYGDERFLEGIWSCWTIVERKGWLRRLLFGKYYYQGYRHPTYARGEDQQDTGISRDQIIYTILALKYAGYSDEAIKEFVTHLRWRISNNAHFTLTLWSWARIMAGIKPYTALYYPIQWLVLMRNLIWNKMLYRCSGFGKESHQADFIKIPNSMKPKNMRRMADLFYPVYSLHTVAWKIKMLPDSWYKRSLQKIALKICPTHNYVIQLLLDAPVKPQPEDIKGYQPMTDSRWTGILNTWINDRDLCILTDPRMIRCNVLDVDYLKRLYFYIKCHGYI